MSLGETTSQASASRSTVSPVLRTKQKRERNYTTSYMTRATFSISDLPIDRVSNNTSIFYGFPRSHWILPMRTTNDHCEKKWPEQKISRKQCKRSGRNEGKATDPAGDRPVADRAGIMNSMIAVVDETKPWQKRPRFSPPIGGSSATLARASSSHFGR